MKNKILLLLFLLFSANLIAQEEKNFSPAVTIKWAPTGLIAGNISLQAEYNFSGKNSITGKIGLPLATTRQFEYDDKDVDFTMKATSFLAGYRHYLSKKQMRGLYLEPYFKYVHHTAEGIGTGTLGTRSVKMNFTNNYNGYGVGAQLGAQFFIGKRFVIDLFFLGPEINSAKNTFKAVEISNSIPWTSIEAEDAEREIREFIDQFPFVKNNTDVRVDRNNKTVTASFKGALPGFRTGVSFGIAL